MAAIITDTFRRNSAKLFISDITNRFNTDDLGHFDTLTPHTNKYYLGIGKSDKWAANEEALNFNIPSPLGSFSDNIEVFNNLATLVLLGPTNTSIVIPNILWAPGNRYRAYDSYDSSCFYSTTNSLNQEILPCYVTIPGDGIYMCLKAGPDVTNLVSIPADDTSQYTPKATSDGYIWVLVQKFSLFAVEFITDQFVEVRRTALEDTVLSPALTNCRFNSGGLVTDFNIIKGGNYTSMPTAYLRGTDGLSYSGLVALNSEQTVSKVDPIKTFTTNIVSSATAFTPGQKVKIISNGDSTVWMVGNIISFIGVTLVIDITNFSPGVTVKPRSWKFEIQDVPNTGGLLNTTDKINLIVTLSDVTSGSITSVSLPEGNYPTLTYPNDKFPSNFLAANVEILGGGTGPTIVNAQVMPIMTPFNGLGYNPSEVMPSWYAGISVSLNSSISNDNFYTPYRQISIIKNANAGNQTTINTLRSLTLTAGAPIIDVNNNSIMTDDAGNILAIADYVGTVNGITKIYFHQNSTTGYREMPSPLADSQASFKIGDTSYSYNEINQSELSKITTDIHGNTLIFNGYPYYGEVIFVENRKKVVRAMNQNEKIKIIIQF